MWFQHSCWLKGTILMPETYYTGWSQKVSVCQNISNWVTFHTSFPQGSVLGPFQYPSHTAPLFYVTNAHNVSMHLYAYNTQLYASFNPPNYADCTSNMLRCTIYRQQWMFTNHLKLNTLKTSCADWESDWHQKDQRKTTYTHQSRHCWYFQLCHKLPQISHIQGYLTQEATKLCNSLLYGIPDNILHKLQLFQNNAACLIMRNKLTTSNHCSCIYIGYPWNSTPSTISIQLHTRHNIGLLLTSWEKVP